MPLNTQPETSVLASPSRRRVLGAAAVLTLLGGLPGMVHALWLVVSDTRA